MGTLEHGSILFLPLFPKHTSLARTNVRFCVTECTCADFCTVLTCYVLAVDSRPQEQASRDRFLPQQKVEADRGDVKEMRLTLTTQ